VRATWEVHRCSGRYYARHAARLRFIAIARPSVRPFVRRTGVLLPCLGRYDRARPLHSTATTSLTRRACSERPASLRARPSIDSRCRQLVTRGAVAVLLLTGSFLRPYLTVPDALPPASAASTVSRCLPASSFDTCQHAIDECYAPQSNWQAFLLPPAVVELGATVSRQSMRSQGFGRANPSTTGPL